MHTLIITTLTTYANSASQATSFLIKNWLLIPGSIVLFFLTIAASALFSPFGLIGRIILGFITIALLSMYYRWIGISVDKQRISYQDLYEFNLPLFWATLGVAFYLSIGDLLFRQSFYRDPSTQWIPAIFGLAVFIVVNALPEVVYTRQGDPLPSFAESFAFTKENWIEWFIPHIIVLLPLLLIDPIYTLTLAAGTQVLLPLYLVLQSASEIFSGEYYIGELLTVIFGTWFMLFRGFLYQELSTGSRRARAYAQKFR